MSSIRIDYNHFPAVITTVGGSGNKLARKFADKCTTYAKENVNVHTGRLRDSIQTEKIADNHWVSTVDSNDDHPGNRDYAHYHEYGNRLFRAYPYMTPAYYEALSVDMPKISKDFGDAVESAARSGMANLTW